MKWIGPTLFGALFAAGVVASAGAAHAQSGARYNEPGAAQPNLGGGFIELLLTGRDPTPRVHAAPTAPPPAASHRGGRAMSDEIIPAVIPAEIPGGRRASAESRAQVASLAQPAHARRSAAAGHAVDPQYRRQVVAYEGREAPGTIVVDTRNRFLYLVQPGGQAIRYGVGVGREGFSWRGTERVTRKAEWPDWRPPESMRRRQPELPRFMAGGPDNPLGARALYLGGTLYRIHGTNEPHTIGHAMSSGCIRMMNEDVIDLYERVRVGSRVVVL